MNKNIIFVGDSFCATYKHVGVCFYFLEGLRSPHVQNQDRGIDESRTLWTIAHPSQVAKHYGYNLYNFGFGGKSWWYSRCRMLNYLEENPGLIENTQAFVFFHTDEQRLNIGPRFESREIDYRQLQRLWKTDLIDTDFQLWAQLKWFQEIKNYVGSIPSIHFHCFTSTPQYSHLLPGMNFTTPLVQLSIGELTGSESEIMASLSKNDIRANHLNEHNNQALADVIINALDNYKPGTYSIDISKFDQPNKNAHRWPLPGYGTK
jgi:hypothetical protein